MTQKRGKAATTPSTDRTAGRAHSTRVWVIHAPSRQARAEAFAAHLRADGWQARAVQRAEGLRAFTWDRVEATFEQIRARMRGEEEGAAKMLDALRDARSHVAVVDRVEECRALDRLRTTLKLDLRIVAWIDGFASSDAWKGAGADAMIAPTKIQCAAAGFDADDRSKVLQIGPLKPDDLLDSVEVRTTARTAMKVDKEQVALIDGTRLRAQDIPSLAAALAQLNSTENAWRWVFYYGDVHYHAEAMRAAAKTYGLSAWMFGDATPIARVLPGCDVVISAEYSALHDAAAWLGIDIFSLQRSDVSSPLTGLGAMRSAPDIRTLQRELSAYFAEDSSVKAPASIQDHAALHRAGQPTEIFEGMERWLARWIQSAPQENKGAPDISHGLAFEAIGDGSLDETAKHKSTPKQLHAERVRVLSDLRKLERNHAEAVETRDEWMERLRDAEFAEEEDLVAFAKERVARALEEVQQLQQRIAVKQEQRDRLRERERDGGAEASKPDDEVKGVPADMEARFRRIAQERQLQALKDRAKREGSS